MATPKESLQQENSFLELVPKEQENSIGQNNQVLQTLDGRYEVSILEGDGYDFKNRVTVTGPEIGVSSKDYYRGNLERTEDNDVIDIRFTGGAMVGWFSNQEGPDGRIEPDPEYVPAAIEAVSGQEIPALLGAVTELDDMEELEEYACSVIEEMEEIYETLQI